MFKAMAAHKRQILDAKKASLKNSDPVLYFMPGSPSAVKVGGETRKLEYGDTIYPVINTINYLDSHDDVHLRGIWNKSVKEQAGQVYYIINHEFEIGKVISYPNEVELMIKEMTWADLGKDYGGSTEALIYGAKITDKSNQDFWKAARDGVALQNSVRMMYDEIGLAVNSTADEWAQEKANWDKWAPVVVNKERLTQGYFFGVSKARIYKEGSAVLNGSNDVTPILPEEPKQHIEPVQTTHSPAAKSTGNLDALNSLLKKLKA